jgi:hypothetical protein
VILPGWFAEHLEPIETAGSGLKSFSELVTSSSVEWDNETIETYQPYVEMNSSTVYKRPDSNYGHSFNSRNSACGFWSMFTTLTNYVEQNPPSYNVDGFKDYYDMPSFSDNGQDQGLMLKIPSFQDLINDNANQLLSLIHI